MKKATTTLSISAPSTDTAIIVNHRRDASSSDLSRVLRGPPLLPSLPPPAPVDVLVSLGLRGGLGGGGLDLGRGAARGRRRRPRRPLPHARAEPVQEGDAVRRHQGGEGHSGQ